MSFSPTPALVAAIKSLAARKAERLTVLWLGEQASFTQCFVIASGTSDRQVKSLADAVETGVREATRRKPSIEGYTHGEWVLLDYGDFIVHVFDEQAREFYRLEALWGDATSIDPSTV